MGKELEEDLRVCKMGLFLKYSKISYSIVTEVSVFNLITVSALSINSYLDKNYLDMRNKDNSKKIGCVFRLSSTTSYE